MPHTDRRRWCCVESLAWEYGVVIQTAWCSLRHCPPPLLQAVRPLGEKLYVYARQPAMTCLVCKLSYWQSVTIHRCIVYRAEPGSDTNVYSSSFAALPSTDKISFSLYAATSCHNSLPSVLLVVHGLHVLRNVICTVQFHWPHSNSCREHKMYATVSRP